MLLLILVLATIASCGKHDRILNSNPDVGAIVFASIGTNATFLYTVNPDGTHLHRLTSIESYNPRWSPNGTRLVFQRSDQDIAVMDANGQNITTITHDDGALFRMYPSWSPDGTQIAYLRTVDPGAGWDIWVMNANGSNPHQWMSSDSTNACLWVNWTSQNTLLGSSFNGIVLQSSPTATHLSKLFQTGNLDNRPRLSPNGEFIAFCQASIPEDTLNIFTIRPDLSDSTQITHGEGQGPVWSPDGTKIAFTRNRKLWIMNADGSNPTPVPIGDIQVNNNGGWGDWR
jgi:Tol biopolymer transport system component